MNKHHRTLELDRVLEMLAEQATCTASKELALRLEPCDNYRLGTGHRGWAAYRTAPAPCSGPSWVPGFPLGKYCRWRGCCVPSAP